MYFIFINSPNEFNKNDDFIALAVIMWTAIPIEIKTKTHKDRKSRKKNQWINVILKAIFNMYFPHIDSCTSFEYYCLYPQNDDNVETIMSFIKSHFLTCNVISSDIISCVFLFVLSLCLSENFVRLFGFIFPFRFTFDAFDSFVNPRTFFTCSHYTQ